MTSGSVIKMKSTNEGTKCQQNSALCWMSAQKKKTSERNAHPFPRELCCREVRAQAVQTRWQLKWLLLMTDFPLACAFDQKITLAYQVALARIVVMAAGTWRARCGVRSNSIQCKGDLMMISSKYLHDLGSCLVLPLFKKWLKDSHIQLCSQFWSWL